MSKIPLILNVDTGIDDAFAIMLAAASDSIELLAITTSFGNNTLEQTTENTLRIVELLGLTYTVPVAAGAEKALMSQSAAKVMGSAAQGDDGLGNKGSLLPYPSAGAVSMSAVELMAKTIRECNGRVVIASTCALTNVAVLLLAHPELKSKIDGIAFSGGAIYTGNVLPTVEANVLADPEAAEIVFRSGIKILMCGLDTTNEAYVTFEDRERFKLANTRPSAFLYEALKHYSDHYENLLLKDGSALHDAVPVAWLADPSLIETAPHYVTVDLNGHYTRGATVVDVQNLRKRPPNAAIATGIDRKEFVKMLFEALRKIR